VNALTKGKNKPLAYGSGLLAALAGGREPLHITERLVEHWNHVLTKHDVDEIKRTEDYYFRLGWSRRLVLEKTIMKLGRILQFALIDADEVYKKLKHQYDHWKF
jgi:hypothetical protein